MIIFDLDTLADCEHRRHFVDPKKNPNFKRRWDATLHEYRSKKCIPEEYIPISTSKDECLNNTYEKFKPDWEAFYEAFHKDIPLEPVIKALHSLTHVEGRFEIWSGRCASYREKTTCWLYDNVDLHAFSYFHPDKHLKMRPIGDTTPDDQLKECWLNESLTAGKNIDFVFDSDPASIKMWRRRGIFVFDCNQGKDEF